MNALIEAAIANARAIGWAVELREYCEDAETPGLLGLYAGVCVHSRKAIKVRTAGMSVEQIAAIIEHEIEHALGAERATDRPELGLRCGGTLK